MQINPKITQTIGRSVLQVQKHSPIILTAVGVVGVVTAGVLAARATLKLEETLNVAQYRLQDASDNEQSRTKAVVENTVDLVKLYGPSVSLAAVSLICIISAQGILHKRNAALVMAYKGLEQSFRNYRERVVEEYGTEVDSDFYHGVRTEEIEDENGNKTKVKVLTDKAKFGEYQFLFGPDNPNWNGFEDRNEWYLKFNEDAMNNLLRFRGHVFLNEVLERLGMEHTPAGAITGWILNSETGDGHIDFRPFKFNSPNMKEHGADDHGIMLDFNVDGVIWDKI